MTFQIEPPRFPNLGTGDKSDVTHQGHPAGPEGVAACVRLGHQQAGARILLQVLRMHGHGAYQEDGSSLAIQPVGHQRAEGKARTFAGKGGKTAHAAHMHQRARAFCKRRFGNGRLGAYYSRTRVLSARRRRHGAP